jgi:hypothetical protein
MMPLNFKYKLFFNASIPLSTNSDVAPLSSSPLVSFEFNKGKVHVVVDGDPITFASGDSTSFNVSTSRIDPINLIIDERGEKVIVVMKKKQKVERELN